MKISDKPEFQQITFNHSLDIGYKDFVDYCKKCTAKPYSFLVNDTTLASDNPLCFTRNLLERIKN